MSTHSHVARLQLLKQKGFYPQIIYDIGAFHGHWSLDLKNLFTKSQFYLFEANESNRPYLTATPFPFYIGVLGDKEGEVVFYSNNSTGDSIFCEKTKYYQGNHCIKKTLPMTTLSSVVEKNAIPLPDLIKLDVQGAENLIIRGSEHIVKNAEVVILETKILEYNEKAPLIHEMMGMMHQLGYCLSDILEYHYLPTGELNEIDLLFIKNHSRLIRKGILIE